MSYFSMLEGAFYSKEEMFVNSILECASTHEEVEMLEEVAFDIKNASDARAFKTTIDQTIEDVKNNSSDATKKKRKLVTLIAAGVAILALGASAALPGAVLTGIAAGVAAGATFVASVGVVSIRAAKTFHVHIPKIINNIDDTIEANKLPSGAVSDLKKARASLVKLEKELKAAK